MKKIVLLLFVFINITLSIFPESYRFAPGEYYMLDGRVNVRTEPNLTGRVIGSLNTNTKVIIVDCAFNEQTIDNFTAYWYKISYNNSYGYIWGGFIAVETFVYDIDKNGIMDYFHYRVSRVENNLNMIHKNNDVFMYINDRHIRSNFVWGSSEWGRPFTGFNYFNSCDFTEFRSGGGQDPRYLTMDWINIGFSIIDHHHDEVVRSGSVVASIYFDMDRFGNINSSMGSSLHSYWESRQ